MTNKSYLSPMCSCIICRKEYPSKGIHTHYSAKHSDNYKRSFGKGTQKFITKCNCVICRKETTVQSLSVHYNSHFKIEKLCPKCGKIHNKNGTYCSYACANGGRCSKESNTKRSITLKARNSANKLYTKISYCKVCGKIYSGKRKTCSEECYKIIRHAASVKGGINGGRMSAAKRVRRSKDEISLYELCSIHYNNIEHNKPIFNGWDADIIIHDTKTAILWNGPWHYKEMGFSNHSLSQVQNRDKIKTKEMHALGWKVLIFEDRYYTPETAMKQILESNQVL